MMCNIGGIRFNFDEVKGFRLKLKFSLGCTEGNPECKSRVTAANCKHDVEQRRNTIQF